jgi:DNA invertase Pin-like site-specific DNA recombinase
MDLLSYARVSTDDKGQLPEVQLAKNRQYADLNNHKIFLEIVDDGVSGEKVPFWERPHANEIKEMIQKNKIQGIIVFGLDRFSRENPIRVLQYIQHLKEQGIIFISVTEPVFNMESEFAEPLQYMLAWFANYFIVQHKRKVLAGMDRAKDKGTKSGKPIGRPKLSGWHKNRIVEADGQGKSIRAIASELGISVGVVHKTLHPKAEKKNPPQTPCSSTTS